jgi:hypothetical protein
MAVVVLLNLTKIWEGTNGAAKLNAFELEMGAESHGDGAVKLNAVDLGVSAETFGNGAVELKAVELDANSS